MAFRDMHAPTEVVDLRHLQQQSQIHPISTGIFGHTMRTPVMLSPPQPSPVAAAQGSIVAVPEDTALGSFRANVKTWMAIDNEIKRLEAALKEGKKAKKELTEKVMTFMSQYNVEDLNTRDGRLRYKVSSVMAPLSQKQIKERLVGFLQAKFPDAQAERLEEELHTAVFNRDRVEKVSLCRLKTLA